MSTRAAAGERPDTTGPLIVEALKDWGFTLYPKVVVPDGDGIESALKAAVNSKVALVVTTGGTGISPTDRTPEATAALLDKTLFGLSAQIVARGVDNGVPEAVLSRGLAGVCGTTLVVNLPGSPGGVKDGLAVLEKVLPHAIGQIAGEDHEQ
ncbi:molybdenum cofactor biosynthesis protein B [Naumannella halotolerans]|uniref:MogA/MoaB family molybdenum cofactor biosynthesis protein n=1 Tax=Naumannella halotolerans TaxID=993414 RepID=UPI001FBA39C2|nr:MogA/MoaB family molybdenum cofactor biosynthesis protein [Naumannella halotolerans]